MKRAVKLAIIGGRVVDPKTGYDKVTDLFLSDGKIIGIEKPPSDFVAKKTIDATNLVVAPGLIDLSVHLREPGLEHKGTIAQETYAAVKGGVTSICCQPTTKPVADTPSVVELIEERVREAAYVNVWPLGAITVNLEGLQLSEYAALKESGCIGLSSGLTPIASSQIVKNCFEYAASFNLPVFVRAKDAYLSKGGVAHEGNISMTLGLPQIPTCAETIALMREIILAEETGVRIHFSCLSSQQAVEMIELARLKGLPVTADVAAHQLHLSDEDLINYNTYCHLDPPLRGKSDQAALKEGLLQGHIQAICSDHQPHDHLAKFSPFPSTEVGASSIETLLPLTLKYGKEKNLSLAATLALLTCKPAEILNINRGRIEKEEPADICIFDPDAQWQLTSESMASCGKNSPFLGHTMTGKVQTTITSGVIVYEA